MPCLDSRLSLPSLALTRLDSRLSLHFLAYHSALLALPFLAYRSASLDLPYIAIPSIAVPELSHHLVLPRLYPHLALI